MAAAICCLHRLLCPKGDRKLDISPEHLEVSALIMQLTGSRVYTPQ